MKEKIKMERKNELTRDDVTESGVIYPNCFTLYGYNESYIPSCEECGCGEECKQATEKLTS